MNVTPRQESIIRVAMPLIATALSIIVTVIGFFMVRTLDNIESKLDEIDRVTRRIDNSQTSQEQRIIEHERRITTLETEVFSPRRYNNR